MEPKKLEGAVLFIFIFYPFFSIKDFYTIFAPLQPLYISFIFSLYAILTLIFITKFSKEKSWFLCHR
ncbi:hypothetical protein MGA3_05885 [Bacillus methanolicus MGA3]|nr:hypothetical protein MGA3_05885 [Bacillus methanolicus MGA3]